MYSTTEPSAANHPIYPVSLAHNGARGIDPSDNWISVLSIFEDPSGDSSSSVVQIESIASASFYLNKLDVNGNVLPNDYEFIDLIGSGTDPRFISNTIVNNGVTNITLSYSQQYSYLMNN